MKQSQNEKILLYIKEHGFITPREAFTEIGCMRLAARISDLKKQGHRIKTQRKTVLTRDGTTTVAAYSRGGIKLLIENNYFVVQAYMVTELGLRGNELLIYAIINGFSQTEGQWFYHRLKYLCEFTQTSKPTVIKSLQSLVNKGLIEKQEESFHGTRICKYRVNNLTTGKETLPSVVKKLNQGGKETLPYINNININTKNNTIDYQEIISLYHDKCPSLPQVKKLTDRRKDSIKARIKTYTKDEIEQAFQMAEQSRFLKGGNDRNWCADFDWIMKDSNMAKILEGKYTDRKKNSFHNFDERNTDYNALQEKLTKARFKS